MTENAEGRPLPRPSTSRWQPLRSGLLNLFRYDHEEFWFEDGHLLLRGNNGTGKSRVLALQLPFLLDGEISSHRMEPDGDPAKRAEWNLLMGQYEDRLGYTWLELGRTVDEDEEGLEDELFVTLGCGLHAVQGRGLVRWFFLTDRRVGLDLFLQGRSGEALSQPRLLEALGERGELFTTVRDYRAAVDRRLFGLGIERYEALVDLLIQLRQPQLSRKLDAAKLSAALSEALPPLDRSILADIAESFRGLEHDRTALEALEAATEGAEHFLRGYRRYAKIAARRRAEAVRHAHSSYDHAQRRLRAAVEQREAAIEGLERCDGELEDVASRAAACTAQIRALESRPEMGDKQTLDAARRRAEDRRLASEQAADDVVRASEQELLSRRRQEEEKKRAEELEAEAQDILERTAGLAAAADLQDAHREAVRPARAEDPTEEQLGRAEGGLDDLSDRRLRGVRHVRQLDLKAQDAARRLQAAKELQSEREAELDEATRRQGAAFQTVETERAALIDAYRGWREASVELSPAGAGELVEDLAAWAEDPRGEGPVSAAVRRAEQSAMEALEARRARLGEDLRGLESRAAELDEEIGTLRAGVHRPPAPPPSRGEGAREDRVGAALWQVCDFAPDLPDAERAGLEAALEAAGWLDAWITPDGRLLEAGELDTVLVAGRSAAAPEGHSLGLVLRPDPAATEGDGALVPREVVAEVLRHLGLGSGSGELWVATDGSFQAGPLHGRGAKPAAQHLGQSAREAERLRRLAALEELLAKVRAEEAAVRAELEQVAERRRLARAEATSAPDEAGVRRAAAELDAAAEFVTLARGRLVAAEDRVQEHREAHREQLRVRDEAAADLGVSGRLEDLETLEEALVEYRRALAALWPALRTLLAARRSAGEAGELHRRAREEEARRRQVLEEAERRRRASEVERDTLEETLGAGVREILRRLDETRDEHKSLGRLEQEARRRREGWLKEQARAETSMEAEERNLERETETRRLAIVSLQRLIEAGLLPVAAPTLELSEQDRSAERSVSRSVEISRALETELANIEAEDGAWERQQRLVHGSFQRLQEALGPHGYPPLLTVEDDLFVVTAPFQGRHQTLDVFRASLGDELAMRQRVLTEREREVIDNHLIGEVALHLHQRLRDAEELVRRMNGQIESRPMSTGLTLRFRWRPLDEELAGLAAARRLLMSEHGLWSPEDRRAVGEFLQERIVRERQRDEAGTWLEHLHRALDYRAWHQFEVERQQDGRWRRLTRRTHGTGSGGEKAIALTVPQFAAAAAHYDTADPKAPRLILLDEAFVGVDADMRAKCMGLLQAFDLDFMMTSEREWACYPTLPGVAIYQLATRPGIDAVAVSRWLWNGREREAGGVTRSPARPMELPEPSSSGEQQMALLGGED